MGESPSDGGRAAGGTPSTVRRGVLAAVGSAVTAGLAGCAARAPDDCDPSDPPPKGFTVKNLDPVSRAVSVEIRQELLVYSATVFEARYELNRVAREGSIVAEQQAVQRASRYVVQASLDGEGDSGKSYLWRVGPSGCDPLLVAVRDGEILIGHPDDVSLGLPGGP